MSGISTKLKRRIERQRENRKRLFNGKRPTIREIEPDDLKWLRVDWKLRGIELGDAAFEAKMQHAFVQYDDAWVIEDRNAQFGAGSGPIGIVAAKGNEFVYEPHVEWFSWATRRNILRGAVAFFQKFRFNREGTIIVHALESAEGFYRRLANYVPLKMRGKIPGGDPHGRGDDYIFYQECHKRDELSI